ncbi:MAG: hypothetical protein E7182_03920 [Erysipelotrichaceae bacterium]|nr:hypothetical protein [Erysipelotrichaceae bacterium]
MKKTLFAPLSALLLAGLAACNVQVNPVASSTQPSTPEATSSAEQPAQTSSEQPSSEQPSQTSSEAPTTSSEPSSQEVPASSSVPEAIHVSSVAFATTSRDAKVGEIIELNPTVLPAEAENKALSWASSDNTVATVSQNGVVRTLKEGVCTITAQSLDNPLKFATLVLNVKETKLIESIALSATSLNLVVGQKENVTASILPVDADNPYLSWSLAPKGKDEVQPVTLEVTEEGATITATAEGTATLFVRSNDGGSAYAVLPITVGTAVVPVTSVTMEVEEKKRSMILGDELQLTATALPENATNRDVQFSSSDTNVVRVDSLTGLVIAVGPGNATVTASSVAYPDVKATVDLSVRELVRVQSITLLDKDNVQVDKLNLTSGEYVDIQAVVTPDNADDSSVIWSSTDPSIASVSDQGRITALNKKGTCTIVCSSKDGGASAYISVTVSNDVLDDIELTGLVADFLVERNTRLQKLDEVGNITSGEDSDRNTYYKNKSGGVDVLKIGDDNPFNIELVGTTYDDETMDENPTKNPRIVYSLEKKVGTGYEAVASTDIGNYLTFGNGKLQLKEAAVGNTFRFTISGDKSKYGAGVSANPVQFEFEAVDGYNVYKAAELCLFDNRNIRHSDESNADPWTALRASMGLAENYSPSRILIQDDIIITDDDLPTSYFYTEAVVDEYIKNHNDDFMAWLAAKNARSGVEQITVAEGAELLANSMIDDLTCYGRSTLENDELAIEGNYHVIDSREVSKVYFFGTGNSSAITNYGTGDGEHRLQDYQGEDGSHGVMFGFNTDHVLQSNGGVCDMRNLTLIGNGGRSNNDDEMGGLMSFKIQATEANFQNIISYNTFMTFMSQAHTTDQNEQTTMNIDRCKSFDSNNSMIYIYGTEDNHISNSYMTGAGGAIALLDEHHACYAYRNDVEQPKFVADVKTENCFFENLVKGTEPWFYHHGAAAIFAMLTQAATGEGWLAQNAAAKGEHKVPVKVIDNVPYVNCIALSMNGTSPMNNSVGNRTSGDDTVRGRALEGGMTINNSDNTLRNGNLDMTAFRDSTALWANYRDLFTGLEAASVSQAMFFESSAGGHGATFPAYDNGVSLTSHGFAPYKHDATYAGYAYNVNYLVAHNSIGNNPMYNPVTWNDPTDSSKGYTKDENKAYTVAELDAADETTLAAKLASGDFMNVYIKAAAGTHYMGMLAGLYSQN